MGYWGEGIYDGDEPLDALSNIFDFSSIEDDDGHILHLMIENPKFNSKELIKSIENNAGYIEDKCIEKDSEWSVKNNIHSAIYAELIMRHGLPLSDNVKNLAKDFIRYEKHIIEDWGDIDRRSFYLEDFDNNIDNYNNEGGKSLHLSSVFVSDKEKFKDEIVTQDNKHLHIKL